MRNDDGVATSALVLLIGKDGYWWQRRAWDDDSHPGCLDFAAGGGIEADETPLAAAARELAEELGVAGLPLPESWRLGPEVAELLAMPLQALREQALHPQLADWLGKAGGPGA
ncbi:NUDIX domain-containing protein [Chromobacterium vaccinii]|uniref:NUDIX domain-containing protein n=1 Tax=Chromobacterium vaccinii TaxID=1108595 RepID=UPI000617F5DA|nr:NUDIX domain-containing protein [Chromobacterium vaccinii]